MSIERVLVSGRKSATRSDDALAEQRSTSRRGERMKRTEKGRANSRQKSMANSRQVKSRANSRQSKPKDCDRDKAKYEGKYTAEEKLQQSIQPASPEASKSRCKCPAGTKKS